MGWYQQTDIAVVPSLLYESFSYTCAQAMAAGVPVVASRIGGIPETVDDGINGILVEPENAEALAAAIIKLAKDDVLRKKTGNKGREKAERSFDIRKISLQFIRLAEAVIKEKS